MGTDRLFSLLDSWSQKSATLLMQLNFNFYAEFEFGPARTKCSVS